MYLFEYSSMFIFDIVVFILCFLSNFNIITLTFWIWIILLVTSCLGCGCQLVLSLLLDWFFIVILLGFMIYSFQCFVMDSYRMLVYLFVFSESLSVLSLCHHCHWVQYIVRPCWMCSLCLQVRLFAGILWILVRAVIFVLNC